MVKKTKEAILDLFLIGGFICGILQIPVLFIPNDYLPDLGTESGREMIEHIRQNDIHQQRMMYGPQIAEALVLFIIGIIHHRKQIINLFK